MGRAMNSARIGGTAALALAGAAAFVQVRTRAAERGNPPLGRFIEVDGVRLHYVEEGSGPPLVLLHGLGSMVEDFVLSGLVSEAARRYRVIAFDRPGYGHSTRPRRLRFNAARQAALLHEALRVLEVRQPIVLGHSLGALVAVELALQRPSALRSLVLASGLYFPSPRLDAPLFAPAAIPLLGDLLAHTVAPLLGRLSWKAWVKAIFAPAPVPAWFARFPEWMALRPSQLRAVGEEAVFAFADTIRAAKRYPELSALPVVLVAGEHDRYVSMHAHTARLHGLLPHSRLLVSPHTGHMVHHSDPGLVLEAIEAAAAGGA